jgi:transcriptional regulator with XRE-family HTH domain
MIIKSRPDIEEPGISTAVKELPSWQLGEADTQFLMVADEIAASATSRPGTVTFPRLLATMREARSWSKVDLAKRAELDPSTITRLEQGSRKPDRETVVQLAEAMALPIADQDRLLAAAGYRSDTWDDPELIEIAALLADPSIASSVRQDIRAMLRVAISHGRLARADIQRR